MVLELLQAILRHHLPSFLIELAAPRKLIPLQSEPVFSARRFQDTDPFRNDFLPYSVAGNGGDSITFHPGSLAPTKGIGMLGCGYVAPAAVRNLLMVYV